jgi:predicted transcriptional regulator
MLAVGLAVAVHAQQPQPQSQQTPAKPSADMSAKCKDMVAHHEKMMADMKAADQRLDELVATMKQASGQTKVDAVAAVVTEMVAQRKTMNERMMQMHQQTMGHMGEHMQAGAKSMAMCPMMKMGGMQH